MFNLFKRRSWQSKLMERIIIFHDSDFITAGDFLVGNCPSWSWESGDLSKHAPYLPSNKQFLILRNVPCLRRASSYEEEFVIIGSDGEEDDRLLIHGDPSESKDEDNLLSTKELPKLDMKIPFTIIPSYFDVDKKEDMPYMDKSIKFSSAAQESTPLVVYDSEDIISPRSYDISITYDNDLQTFHFWLTGYLEDGRPLQPELSLQDVVKIHVDQTVKIEDHPYLPGKHASVHPIIHGAALINMLQERTSDGLLPDLEIKKCLFLFLKFISSVFPTVKYDCKMDFDLESSSK